MNFRGFLEKTWDAKDYCNLLALDARMKAHEIISEMAMAAQNVSKMPMPAMNPTIRKFLMQFRAEDQTNALHWLFSHALVKMMKQPRERGEIPEGWNWTSRIELPDPNRPKDKTVVYETPGKKEMYLGLTDLVHEMSNPPKKYRGQTSETLPEEARRYWKGDEGPAIGEIDPKQTDPNHPQHPSKYKHGLYDFDFEDMAEATPEDIDEKSDYQIHKLLPLALQELPLTDPKVQAAIKTKRENMKDVLKTSFGGYDVLQRNIAAQAYTNAIKANALEERPYGEHPKEIKDPITGQTYPVEYLNPNEVKHGKLQDDGKSRHKMHSRWDMRIGNGSVPLNIPAIKKTFHFKIKDNKTGKESDEQTETSYIPIVNDVKSIPNIKLTEKQKEQLAERRGPGGLQSAGNLQGLLNIWDMLSDDQKKYIKEHSKSMFEIAHTYHNEDEGLRDKLDPRAALSSKPYIAGFRPNYKANERPTLSVPAEKAGAFIDHFKPMITAEVMNPEEDEKGRPVGKLDRMIKAYESSEKYGKQYPQVIEALRDNAADIGEIVIYNLLTWLDNPRFGIKDDDFGTLRDVSWNDYSEERNRKNREHLVFNYVSSIAQIGFAGIPPRRIREKQGLASQTALSQLGTGDKDIAGQVQAGSIKSTDADNDPVRAALYSWPGQIVRAAQKTHMMFSGLEKWLSTNRNAILNKLPSKEAAQDLEDAGKNIVQGLQISVELYNKIHAELAQKIKDPEKLEDETMKLVHQELPDAIKKHFAGMPDKGQEAILNQLKTVGNLGVHQIVSQQLDTLASEKYNKFLDDLITKGEGRIPIYNPHTNSFEEGGEFVLKEKMKPNQPQMVIQLIDALYPPQFANLAKIALKEKGPKIYDTAESELETDKDSDEATKEYEIALLKWNAQKATAAQAAPSAAAQVAPAVKPQAPAAPAAQPAAAAKSIPELISQAGNINNLADVMSIGQAMLNKKQELMAQKGSAEQVYQFINAIKERMNNHQIKGDVNSYKLLGALNALKTELMTAHSA